MTSEPCKPCAQAVSERRTPTEALLFTQNTTRNPISWNPALRQPNPNEVLHSVHLALHRALDPCISGNGDTCSWTVVPEEVRSTKQSADVEKTSARQILVVPKPSDLHPPSQEVLDHSEISVKLRFYGSHDNVDRVVQVDEALKSLRDATGFSNVDRFVIGFDSIRWAGGDEESTKNCEQVSFLVLSGVWQQLSSNPSLKMIGVSDFSSCHVSQMLSLVDMLGTSEIPIRRPRINQLNFDRDLPEPLVELAKTESMELQSHSDNRVPYEGIEVLLKEFQEQLPLPEDFEERRKQGIPAIDIAWVLKYTIVLKDRGLVADKGFILSFSFCHG